MLKYGNRELRNLEDQVEKNAQDIEDFKNGNQTIAEFGITVVGILATADELPAQGENFGDAYLIGSSTPYDMRVWTRDVANSTAKWVDLGAFPLQGPKGDKGNIGSVIRADAGAPLNNPTSLHDFYLDTISGYWYVPYLNETGYGWLKSFTLKGEKGDRGEQGKQGVQGLTGPQGKTGPIGPQGPKGNTGDVGPAFNVQGTLASSSNLPTPTADMQDKGYAYIIPDAQGTKHIWVIQGPEGGPFSWVDVGAAGVGIQGPKGTDGVGLNTLTDTNLTYGNTTVTYDTTDGIGINSTMRQTYGDTNHDSTVDMNIPIVAGDGIAINKKANEEKVEVKVELVDGKAEFAYVEHTYFPQLTLYGAKGNSNAPWFRLTYNGIQCKKAGPGDPISVQFDTYGSVLTNNSVKTIFGNSIYGTGNIGLYRHVIKITGRDVPYSECFAYLTIISSENLKVEFFSDLITLLGDTFEYPATGYDKQNLAYVYKITQDGIVSTNNQGSSVTLSFANMTKFTDTVTAV